MIKLFCFGVPQINRLPAATPLHLTPKAMALFVYLAVTQRPHSRDLLADLLWSETNNAQARTNLRYLLPELRQALADYLLITPRSIAFNTQCPFWLDVDLARTALLTPAERVTPQELQTALDLYQGEFLAGFTARHAPVFEAWLLHEREYWHTLVVQGCHRLAECYWQQADYPNALATTRRLLSWEPWHEAGHRLQMQLLAATGQRAAALAHYALCRQILADELGATPDSTTTALYAQIQKGEWVGQGTRRQQDKKTGRQEDGQVESAPVPLSPVPLSPVPLSPVPLSPPLPAPPAISHNLPQQTTSFIGRDEEVAELCTKILNADCRLLTLVGEGGIGKTRLALAVAQTLFDPARLALSATSVGLQMVDSTQAESPQNPTSTINHPKFPDGIWFIPLADLAQDRTIMDRLATVVAKTVGLSFSGNQPLFTQLLAHLRRKALCLLFDNAEHLLPTIADFLLQILQQSPHTTILVTSRHVLNLQAEMVWRVAGLPVPPSGALASLSLHELTNYSSIALFVERTNRIQKHFPLAPADGSTIAAICRLVEGLPLAIELAAALTKQYPCAELYSALQRDYTILAAPGSTHLSHHHSIQAMLDYSWRFLTTEEAHLLAACAIFAGGFTRGAVITVTGATPALLLNLIDQSLLQMRAGRFFMHELVRHYAAAQLAQFPECQARVAAAHAAYYIDLLHEQEAALVIDFAAQQTIQDEIENIRAAWLWSVAQGDLALLAKGLDALHYFYRLTGTYQEALQLLEAALATVRQCVAASPTDPQRRPLLARLLCHIAEFYRRMNGGETGVRLAQEALTIGQQLADPALQGLAYHRLARLAYTHNQFLLMCDLAAAGVQQAQQAGSLHLLAECLNDSGLATGACYGPQQALPYCQQALAVLQGATNRILEAFVLVNLGYFSLASGHYQAAATHLQQGLALQRQLQDRGGRVAPLTHLLNLWLALGVYEAVSPIYAEAFALVQTIGNPYWESSLQISYGRWQQRRGDTLAARATYMHALQVAQASRNQIQEQLALVYLGHTLATLGNVAGAEDCYQQAIRLHQTDSWLYRTADAYAGLAALLLAQNRLPEAIAPIEAALTLMAQHGLAAANEPFLVYWTAVRIFTAVADPRATTVLRTAYQQLQAIAAQLTDERLRHTFLQEVPVNHHLMTAAQSAEIG